MTGNAKSWRTRGLAVLVVAVLAALAWQTFKPTGLGEGFASGNGRIEATEVDVATKLAGRVAEMTWAAGWSRVTQYYGRPTAMTTPRPASRRRANTSPLSRMASRMRTM